MQKEELYNKTVNILVQAYFNDTLEHNNCYACAVGNIVSGNNNYEFEAVSYKKGWVGFPNFYREYGCSVDTVGLWASVFCTHSEDKTQDINFSKYKGRVKQQIDSTGYSLPELAKIEFAFETATEGESEDEWMFNGLCSVLDVLSEIHQVDNIVTEQSKSKIMSVYARNMERCS